MYVNVGAYVDERNVDRLARSGRLLRAGRQARTLSAAAQIGGVFGTRECFTGNYEDDVLVGGNCGVYEGTQVRSGAVLGAGVILRALRPCMTLSANRSTAPTQTRRS